MAVITDIKNALKTRLETISGLRVFNQPMDSINEFPSAVILNEGVDYALTFGGTNASGVMRVSFFVDSAVTNQSCRALDTYLHPGNSTSVVRAIYGDSSLGGTAQIVAVSAENIGPRELPDGNVVVGADFVTRWVR